MKCDVNIKGVKLTIYQMAEDYAFDNDITLDEFESLVIEFIDSLHLFNIPNPKLLSQAIFTGLTTLGGLDEDEFINLNNVEGLVNIISSGQRLNLSKTARVEDGLPTTEDTENKKKAETDFFNNAYKSAKQVQRAAQIEANTSLFDACFINRGSIQTMRGVVADTTNLNKNLLQYLELLLQRICKFLQTIPEKHLTEEQAQAIANPKLYNIVGSKYENTGILYTIQPLIDRYLSPNKVKPEKLNELFANDDKVMLDAYNANVILSNFDKYIKANLGKAIEINRNDFGKKTGSLTKYRVASSTASLATNWRTSENIDVESEIDSITRLLVNTTPVYNWDSSTPKKGEYMTFLNYQNILGKIKEMGLLPKAKKVLFNREFIDAHQTFWNSLSDKTQKYIEGKTLSEVINYLRKNPRAYLHSIFEVLANNEFKKLHGEVYESLEGNELNHIYSSYKSLFNPNPDPNTNVKSIRNIVGLNPKLDYYAFLALASDSIFKNTFIQYYRDNGVLKTRLLTDMSSYRIKMKVMSDIETNNFANIKLLEYFNALYNDTSKKVTFTIPGTNNLVTVDLSTEKCTYSDSNFLSFAKNKDVLSFLDDVLVLGLSSNSELLSLIDKNNMSFTMERLLNLASNVVASACVVNTQLNNLPKGEVLYKVNEIFLTPRLYDKGTRTVKLIADNSSNMGTINEITRAIVILNGIATSTLVKDSQQASQNLQSLSRLLGSIGSQFDLIELQSNSATEHFTLLRNKDLFLGHYTTSEYYDKLTKKNKGATKFSVSEMIYANIMSNFVPAFLETKNDFIGNGTASFLASVNSDKGTIGQLLVNLNSEVTLANGEVKSIINLSDAEIEEFMKRDLGNFYLKLLEKLQSDWDLIRDQIKLKYEDCPPISYTNFTEFNNWCAQKGFDPESFVKKVVLYYNFLHPLKPIELVDLVHYKLNNGQLYANNAILAEIAKFKPEEATQLGIDINYYPSYSEFFALKSQEVLLSLLKSGTKFNLLEDNPVNNYIKEKQKEIGWVNSSDMMILARVNINGEDHPIVSKADLLKIGIETGLSLEDILKLPVTLNPILNQYNLLDTWLTLLWMNSSVGSFVAHPGKATSANGKEILDKYNKSAQLLWNRFESLLIDSKTYYAEKLILDYNLSKELTIIEEAAMFQDLHKRNVSMTALMHEFMLNTLNGITELYNVAVIEDIKDKQAILFASDVGIKPYDGATFVNPFTVYLENNSLGGAKAGFDKKQFVHFKNGPTGTGGIIKTAGFGITNDRMRRSPNGWLKLMELMTNRKWLDENGHPLLSIDITKGFNNRDINFKPIYFAKNGELFRISEFKNIGPNLYERTIELVDNRGKLIKKLTRTELALRGIQTLAAIDSNFGLWKFFGGEWSLKLSDKGILVPSETSIERVIDYMNQVGIVKTKPDGTKYRINEIETLDEVWLPLKQSDIHYLATAGAVKQGAANINSRNKYGTNEPLDFLRIYMYQAGILLDKEHHADNAELSLPTLIISACASLGYTIDKANALYKGLALAADLGILTLLDSTKAYFNDQTVSSRKALQEEVLKLVAKNLATSNSDSFAKTIAQSVVEAVKNNPNLKFSDAGLPLSDNSVFAKMLSTIASHVTKSAIRLKLPGLLAVLSPSHNLYTLKGDRTWDSLYNWSSLDLKLVDEYLEANPNNIITDKAELLLEALQWNTKPVFKALISEGISGLIPFTNDLHKVNLGRYYTLTYENGLTKDVFINTPRDLRRLRQLTLNGDVIQVAENIKQDRNLGAYNVRFKTTSGEYFLLWDLDSVYYMHEASKLKTDEEFQAWFESEIGRPTDTTLKQFKKYWSKRVQKDLESLSKSTNSNEPVYINGTKYQAIKESIDVLAYELIMPKVYINEFGFDEFTDLNEVRNDKDWFVKQYILNQNLCNGRPKPKQNQFDIELRNGNGNHIYLIDEKHLLNSGLKESLDEIQLEELDGKIVRTDLDGNVLYEFLEGSKIYIDSHGNEVIVVSDTESLSAIKTMNQYVELLSFDTINLSLNLNLYGDYAERLAAVLEENKRVGNFFLEYITLDADDITTLSVLNNFKNLAFNHLTVDNYKKYYNEISYIIRAGHRKHTAFLKSLDIVAARIPSLSLQSFMPMKVVAYDNPNRNAAYVSNLQLLLLGSDLDIDAVSLVMFDINSSGQLDLWSPYSNTETKAMMEASMELPFPSGHEVEIKETSKKEVIKGFLEKYLNLFTIKRNEKGKLKVILLNNKSVSNLRLLKLFLEESSLYLPTNNIMLDSISAIKSIYGDLKIKGLAELLDIFNLFKEIADKHHTYLQDLRKHKLNRILNNYIAQALYSVIQDPVNQTLALTSVDETTGPLKAIANASSEAKAAHTRTYGNAHNKAESIEENLVGKDCIAISAVGLKAFFALTEYANTILNEGTAEELGRLLGNNLATNDFMRLALGKMGETKTLLANIRAKDPKTVTNQEVLSLLLSAERENEQDLALVLSALLSLSTDNAKDLGLAKLNAGSNMIGAYIYGITIGMDFREISEIMMSLTGRIVRDIIDENMMQKTPGYNKLSSAFEYFKNPYRFISLFDQYKSSSEERASLKDAFGNFNPTPLKALEKIITQFNPFPSLTDEGGEYSLDKLLPALGRSNPKLFFDNLKIFDEFRDKYTGPEKDVILYNQLIDFCLEYLIQCKNIDLKTLMKLEQLSKGAEEMKVLGLLVGLNQGIPGDLSGIFGKIRLIEEALLKLPDKGKRRKIDLLKFAFNTRYREGCIGDYEEAKVSFNILDVISKVPHIFKYVLALAVVDAMGKASYRYRTIRESYGDLQEKFGGSLDDICKGISGYLGNKMISDWMFNSLPPILIPAKNRIFDLRGILSDKVTTKSTPIQLGFDYTNATFRRWMETEVIPNLKLGIIGNRREEGTILKSNLFIRGLKNDTKTNTNSGNGSIVYTLPINMMPRNDVETNILNNYRNSFNLLDRFFYYVDGNPIPITDLFALYGLIAHEGKTGESSLMPIFENYQNSGLLKSLHDYIGKLDDSEEVLDLSLPIYNEQLKYYLASKSTYGFSPFAWGFNEENNRVELLSKGRLTYTDNDSGYSYKDPGIGNYKYLEFNTDIELNYFPNVNVDNRSEQYAESIKLNDNKNYNINFVWNKGLGGDYIEFDKEKIEIGNFPVKTKNGITLPDFNLIKKEIREFLSKKLEEKKLKKAQKKEDNENNSCIPAPF